MSSLAVKEDAALLMQTNSSVIRQKSVATRCNEPQTARYRRFRIVDLPRAFNMRKCAEDLRRLGWVNARDCVVRRVRAIEIQEQLQIYVEL